MDQRRDRLTSIVRPYPIHLIIFSLVRDKMSGNQDEQ